MALRTPSPGAQVRDRNSTGERHRGQEGAEKGRSGGINVLCGSTSLLNPKPSIYAALARLLGSRPLSSAAVEGLYANEFLGNDNRLTKTSRHRWT